MGDLEKTVWSFKHLIDDDLSNENIEIILNFINSSEYEINLNRYVSSL